MEEVKMIGIGFEAEKNIVCDSCVSTKLLRVLVNQVVEAMESKRGFVSGRTKDKVGCEAGVALVYGGSCVYCGRPATFYVSPLYG